MTITEAQQIQSRLTDKYVIVQDGIPELRRFVGLTGRVKTVNMSGRALVQFDGPVDIGWYDIDPAYLQVIDQPLPKKAAGHDGGGQKQTTEKAPPAPKAAPAAGGKSPLDLIRKQGAAQAEGGKKPSPLDLIRQQAAAKSTDTPEGSAASSPADAPSAESPASAPASPPTEETKGLSPLELIRRQGAAKR